MNAPEYIIYLRSIGEKIQDYQKDSSKPVPVQDVHKLITFIELLYNYTTENKDKKQEMVDRLNAVSRW